MRDRRIDFWRGLCLVDMILVHLLYEGVQFGPLLAGVIGEYTRFAAGGFVFVAGLGVGTIFLPRARAAASRWGAYVSLWRRAAYILGVHYASAASFLTLDLLRGQREVTQSPLGLFRDVLLLREAPPYGDILPLYVMLLAAAPLLLEALRRGLGPLVALGSAALFWVGQGQPWLLSPRAGELFPLVLWQGFFAAGLLLGAVLPQFDRLRTSRRVALTALVSVAFVALTGSAHAYLRGHDPVLPLAFVKVPLSAGELARYLATTLVVILVTAFGGGRLANSAPGRFVSALGEKSLAVYVAHVWCLAAIAPLAAGLAWMGVAQVLFVPLALAALWLVARALREPVLPRLRVGVDLCAWLRGWAAPPVGVAAAAALLLTLTPPAPPEPVPVEVADVDPVALEAAAEIELVDVEVAEPELASPEPLPELDPEGDELDVPAPDDEREVDAAGEAGVHELLFT